MSALVSETEGCVAVSKFNDAARKFKTGITKSEIANATDTLCECFKKCMKCKAASDSYKTNIVTEMLNSLKTLALGCYEESNLGKIRNGSTIAEDCNAIREIADTVYSYADPKHISARSLTDIRNYSVDTMNNVINGKLYKPNIATQNKIIIIIDRVTLLNAKKNSNITLNI